MRVAMPPENSGWFCPRLAVEDGENIPARYEERMGKVFPKALSCFGVAHFQTKLKPIDGREDENWMSLNLSGLKVKGPFRSPESWVSHQVHPAIPVPKLPLSSD